VLFETEAGPSVFRPEFALDLDAGSEQIQLVVARIAKGATLGAMVDEVDRRTRPRRFGPNDILQVPDVGLSLEHRFRELEGPSRRILNPGCEGLYIDVAKQSIRFDLDKGGAELRAEAAIVLRPIPARFDCDGPFLVFMRRRAAKRPFFALWVDGPEVLKPLGRLQSP